MKNLDVCALGELLIDFTCNGLSAQGNKLFEANPGGAPCNVLAMLANLGYKTGFIGKVGSDMFGKELKQRVSALGIDVQCLYEDNTVNTTLAFIETLKGGERDFSFYRNPGADIMLNEDEIDEAYIKNTKLFQFGTLSMTHNTVRNATKKAVLCAKGANAIISFDPNIREPLWNNMQECKEQVEWGILHCDILKISDNEIEWLTNEHDYEKAAQILLKKYTNIKLLLVSLGSNGSLAYCKNNCAKADALLNENTIETTGAGDSFLAACLHFVLEHGMAKLDAKAILEEMLKFANATASIVTTRKGALCVMPKKEEILDLLHTK